MAQCARGRELRAPRAQLSTVPWDAHTQWSGNGFAAWAGFAKQLGDLPPGLCSSQRRRAPLRPRYRSHVRECAPPASSRLVAQPSVAALAASTVRSQLSSAFGCRKGCTRRLLLCASSLRSDTNARQHRTTARSARSTARAAPPRPTQEQQSLQRIRAMSLSSQPPRPPYRKAACASWRACPRVSHVANTARAAERRLLRLASLSARAGLRVELLS